MLDVMFYVYIMQSLKDRKLYIGSTTDLRRRMAEHGSGKVRPTRHRLPLRLVCYEGYLHKEEAQRREKFLKSSDGHKDLAKRLTKSIGNPGGIA